METGQIQICSQMKKPRLQKEEQKIEMERGPSIRLECCCAWDCTGRRLLPAGDATLVTKNWGKRVLQNVWKAAAGMARFHWTTRNHVYL